MAPRSTDPVAADNWVIPLAAELCRAEERFRRACDQIVLMNGALLDHTRRYKRARDQNLRSFRYTQRLRLAVLEGVRNMFYDYATQKASEICELREFLDLEADGQMSENAV